MPEVVLPAAIARVRVLDPALADALAEDFTRLSRASGAVAWSQAQLVRMLAAPGEQAVLAEVVAAARETTRAPRAWSLTWRGDLATGRASFTALAGDGAALDSPPEVSRTILGRVAKEGRPAWSDDASQDARFLAAESVQQASLRSVGCVPLGTSGALWLEDPDNPGRFTPDARMRVAALCALAGRVLAGRRRAAAPVHAKRQVEPVPGLVGEAPAMDDLYASIRAFAPMPWPALILGETGTGKELVARAMHELSPRSSRPFLAVNCGAIVETLAESALFGHERGAFTGADRRQEGLLDRVRGGTLFLDEVGELSPTLQVKLLRLLQEGTYERVGGHEPLRFSGRVVAATHRPLEDAQARGTFREDLFYRLAAGVVRVPPLRDRRTDIPGLARHLLARAAAELSLKEPPSLAPDAVDELCARAWAGNVRELENALRLGLALSLARSEGVLRLADLRAGGPRRPLEPALSVAPPVDADGGIDPSLDLAAATERFQEARVRAALEANGGNRSAAARQLGVSRQWLHRLLSRWDDADAEGGQ